MIGSARLEDLDKKLQQMDEQITSTRWVSSNPAVPNVLVSLRESVAILRDIVVDHLNAAEQR